MKKPPTEVTISNLLKFVVDNPPYYQILIFNGHKVHNHYERKFTDRNIFLYDNKELFVPLAKGLMLRYWIEINSWYFDFKMDTEKWSHNSLWKQHEVADYLHMERKLYPEEEKIEIIEYFLYLKQINISFKEK